nr:hypothetical protein [Kribbella antibiotica]
MALDQLGFTVAKKDSATALSSIGLGGRRTFEWVGSSPCTPDGLPLVQSV